MLERDHGQPHGLLIDVWVGVNGQQRVWRTEHQRRGARALYPVGGGGPSPLPYRQAHGNDRLRHLVRPERIALRLRVLRLQGDRESDADEV